MKIFLKLRCISSFKRRKTAEIYIYYLFDGSQNRAVFGYGEYLAVPAQPTVFVDDALRYVEHTDVGHHTRLLAVDVYPLVFVKVGADILFRQVAHIGERQAREGAEQV